MEAGNLSTYFLFFSFNPLKSFFFFPNKREVRIKSRNDDGDRAVGGGEGRPWVPGRVEMAVQANYNRANKWKPIFARGSNHTCTRHYWCTCFRLRGCKQRGSVKSPKGDRRGSWILVPTLEMMVTSDSPVFFRTVCLILLFSQYLSKVDVPMIAYKDKKWKVFQYPLFKLFSVSRCPA